MKSTIAKECIGDHSQYFRRVDCTEHHEIRHCIHPNCRAFTFAGVMRQSIGREIDEGGG